ncbi:MAG: radical SAM protein [Planctomycetota bacterium]
MNILLVNASVKARSRHARLSPPLGLAYIASVLLDSGHAVTAEDCNLTDFNPTRMRRLVEDRAPRIVGISTSTETYPNGRQIAAIVKEVNPAITVVMGGPHATVMHREVASDRDVDIVVRGEGEYTMLELADCLATGNRDLSQVRGLTYRRNGHLTVTPDRPFIADPDRLPFPARELFPLPMYERSAAVLTSRGGCPCDCVFCAVNSIWKGKRRFRSPERIVEEMVWLVKTLGCEEISFADDTFTLSRKHVMQLCEQLARFEGGLFCEWRCTTRVDMVDTPLLETMCAAGCTSITFGIESGSQRILDSIEKRITREQVVQAVDTALGLDMEVLCSFMFPHPDDTEETVREQKAFMNALVEKGAIVTLALTTPFPGTPYYEHADEFGISILTDQWDEFDAKHLVITTRYLSEDRLRALLGELLRDVGMRSDSQPVYDG